MAETAMGAGSQLAWNKETTWGTPVATPMKAVPITGETLEAQINKLESAEIRPDRHFAKPVQGSIHPQGDVNVEWNASALGYFLYYLTGSTPVVTGTGPYNHTLLQTHNVTLPMVTLEKGFKDIAQYYRYPGARVSRVTFAVAPDAFVTGAIGWMMKDEVNSGTPLDATLTDIAHAPLTAFEAEITEGGAALATSTKFDLTLDNQLMSLAVIGSRAVAALLAQRFRANGTLQAFFANNTMYAKFRNFTETSIVMKLLDLAGQFVQVDLKSVFYEGRTPQIAGEGPVYLDLPFSASHDSVSGEQIEIVVENDQASLTA